MAERKKRYRGVIAVDAGGLLVPNPAFVTEAPGKIAARADLYLRAMAAMGYVALNAGAHELALGPSKLAKLARKHKIALLSANIVYDKGEKPVFRPWILRRVGGLKVGIFGLVSESPPSYGQLFIKRGLRVTSAVNAARKAVAKLQDQGAELIVALSQLKRSELEDLAAQVDGLHVVIGSTGMQLSMHLERLDKVLFADTYVKGKYVGELLVHPGVDRTAYAVANPRRAAAAEKAMAEQELRAMRSELEAAERPGSGLNLTEQSKAMLRQRLAAAKARVQRAGLEMHELERGDADAGAVELAMHALGADVKDDRRVLAMVNAFKKRFPAPAGTDRH